ncbi:hypothetical protein PAERUG_P47_London_12_VIM_2_12_12_03462 [Pseudomonas aeruginosa]|nr:hypothetical protein PAERUG_P47_London_12_VIM_2_12_12_03462 [Pseudomonas aeruginosa]CRR66008.1 hypothetical protein PAERUG_P48_London_17_VIM_2_01_13_01182 [Pseudomonas aeruginosa]
MPVRCRYSASPRGIRVRSSSWVLTLKRWRGPRRMTSPPSSNSSLLSRNARTAWSRAAFRRASTSSALTLSFNSRRRSASSRNLRISGSAAKNAFSSSAWVKRAVRRCRLSRIRRAASSSPWALRWRSSSRVCLCASKVSSSSSRLARMSPRNCSWSPNWLSSSSSCTSRRDSCSSQRSGSWAWARALVMPWPKSLNWAPNWATVSIEPSPLRRCSARALAWFRRA